MKDLRKRKGPRRVATDKEFQRELNIFQEETAEALQTFRAFMAIHAAARENVAFYHFLNRTPMFWIRCVNALHADSIMSLGRVFDQDSLHNLDRLIRMAQSNPAIFSKASLERRIVPSGTPRPPWIDEVLRDAYQPTPQDFRILRKLIERRRKIYCASYRDLRNLRFAHRAADSETIAKVYEATNVDELQTLLGFLRFIHSELSRLFDNGRKLTLHDQSSASKFEDIDGEVASEVADFVKYILSGKTPQREIAD
jgi:AbiU2